MNYLITALVLSFTLSACSEQASCSLPTKAKGSPVYTVLDNDWTRVEFEDAICYAARHAEVFSCIPKSVPPKP